MRLSAFDTEIRFVTRVCTVVSAFPACCLRVLTKIAELFFVTFNEFLVATVLSVPGATLVVVVIDQFLMIGIDRVMMRAAMTHCDLMFGRRWS